MKKIDLGQTIAILANVGVIAGIVFLAIEIRESREQAVIANAIQGTTEIYRWIQSLAEEPEIAELFQRGAENFDGLSELEQFRFDSLMRSGIGQIGLMDLARSSRMAPLAPGEPENRVIEGNLLRIFERKGVREWWLQSDKKGIPLPTVELIDELIDHSR